MTDNALNLEPETERAHRETFSNSWKNPQTFRSAENPIFADVRMPDPKFMALLQYEPRIVSTSPQEIEYSSVGLFGSHSGNVRTNRGVNLSGAKAKSSITVAAEFTRLASGSGDSLGIVQVIKLVYICHGWMLVFYNRPLIRDEIQAWQYGPVIPVLYDKLRMFMSSPVGIIADMTGEFLDPEETDLIGSVYDSYGKMSGTDLSQITHKKGSPWDLTYRNGFFGDVISDNLIKDHYSRLLD